MSCTITYKGKKYSEEQFKEYFINNKQEFTTSIAKNKDVIDSFKRKMEAIDGVFKDSPELASIGTKTQYMQYLSTIFKTSKVKDIFYHGTDATFEKFVKMHNNIHFGTLKAAKERLETIKKIRKSTTENIYPVILNIEKPIITDADFDWELDSAGEQPDPYELLKTVGYLDNWLYENGYLPKEESDLFGLPDKSIPERVSLWKNHDSYIYKNFVEDKGSKSYSVFEPEQIHILGSKQDIEGFKKFKNINTEVKKDAEEVYSKLGKVTKSEHVVIKPWGELKDATKAITPQGIVSTRIPNTNEHFGNPFSHDPVGKAQGLIKTETVKDAVEKYIEWLTTDKYDFDHPLKTMEDTEFNSFHQQIMKMSGSTNKNTQEQFSLNLLLDLLNRKKWIRKQIESGELKGKPILYYKELGEPSHATALDYLINKYNWNKNQSTEIKPKIEYKDWANKVIGRFSLYTNEVLKKDQIENLNHTVDLLIEDFLKVATFAKEDLKNRQYLPFINRLKENGFKQVEGKEWLLTKNGVSPEELYKQETQEQPIVVETKEELPGLDNLPDPQCK